MEHVGTVDDLFDRHYSAIVRALAVAFDDAEGAADAVQEAFIEADRRWRTIGQYEDPAAWVRRVAINRLRNGRRNRLRRAEILAAIHPVAPEDMTDALLDLRRGIDDTSDPRPEIDFEQQVVVSITIPDDACPPELTAFDRAGDTITPVFVEPEGACIEPLIPKTYAAALDWASVGDAFTLRLPADGTYGFGEQRLAIDRSVSPRTSTLTSVPLVEDPQSTCADIEAFAERITDTGITYDHEASASPEALFESADVVLYGTLTGGFDEREVAVGEDPTLWSFVGYEIDVEAAFKPLAARLPSPLYIWLEYSPASVDSRAFEDVAIPGTPVVVFAHASESAPGYTAAIEGFATVCPGEAPIGRVGGTDEWRSVTSLDALAARLEAAANG